MYTKPGVRGCGIRTAGSTYLCQEQSLGGRDIEEFILDPCYLWSGDWKRGFKILPAGDHNNVAIFVEEMYYKSLWDFVEEARHFGISGEVPPTFPFGQLTPGKSNMILLHRKAIPKFLFQLNRWTPLDHCRQDIKGIDDEVYYSNNLHKNPDNSCAFAHKDLAYLIHNYDQFVEECTDDKDHNPSFRAIMPEFYYEGLKPHCPIIGDFEWSIGAFMAVPLTHVEFPHKANKQSELAANKAGFETVVLEY